MAGPREERLARNEALFRTANERMRDWEERHPHGDAELYYCECVDPECRAKVSLTRREYEDVRANSRHFVVLPGHEMTDVETVIREGDGWSVIEKDENVTETVEALDPRRG